MSGVALNDLSGRNTLVTGTSRGIGTAIARGLASAGARVLCHARTERDARALADELGGAAINPRGHESFDEVEREIFEEVLRVNVLAPLFLTQALLGPLRAAGSARVVVLSSQSGQFSG